MFKIVFLQAHPDDLEFNSPHLVEYLSKRGKYKYDIRIASMTRGEYGTAKNQNYDFKGERLGKIRTREMYKAASIHGIKKDQIHFFGIIDGYVQFDKKTIQMLGEYLNKEKPDIIFAPEARNTVYRHPDHMNTGKCVFYLLHKGMIKFSPPKLYFYTPINANFYWPFRKEEISFALKLMHTHRSQFHLWNSVMPLYKLMGRIFGRHVKGYKYAEGYRQVFYGKEIDKNKNMSLLQRILFIMNVRLWPEKVTNHTIESHSENNEK